MRISAQPPEDRPRDPHRGVAATIGGALVFEHGFGLRPCKLCLEQRYPYYLGHPDRRSSPSSLPARFARRRRSSSSPLVFLVSAGLGIYHAGVEWGFFGGSQRLRRRAGADRRLDGRFPAASSRRPAS